MDTYPQKHTWTRTDTWPNLGVSTYIFSSTSTYQKCTLVNGWISGDTRIHFTQCVCAMLHTCTSTYMCLHTPVFPSRRWTWRWGSAQNFRAVLSDVTLSKYGPIATTDHGPLAFPPLGGKVNLGEKIDVVRPGLVLVTRSPRRNVVRAEQRHRMGGTLHPLGSFVRPELRSDSLQ